MSYELFCYELCCYELKMRKRVCKPSSVSPEDPGTATIPLARALLPGSSDLPGSIERATLKRSPIRSCTGWGLPCQPCHQGRGELLPRLFTLTPQQARGGMFSVALSLGSPPVAVSDHPALWSPDFPPATRFARRAITRPPSATDKNSNLAHNQIAHSNLADSRNFLSLARRYYELSAMS